MQSQPTWIKQEPKLPLPTAEPASISARYEDNHNLDIERYTSSNGTKETYSIKEIDYLSTLQDPPFKVILPSNFNQQIKRGSENGENDASNGQHINNFKIINEPLKFEDFNMVDELMAEPIWSTIKENVRVSSNGIVTDDGALDNFPVQTSTSFVDYETPAGVKTEPGSIINRVSR